MTALQAIGGMQIGDADQQNVTLQTSSPIAQFQTTGMLRNQQTRIGAQLTLAFQDRFVIPARGTVQRFFAITVQPTLERVRQALNAARSKSATDSFQQTADLYKQWMTGPGKKQLASEDEGFRLAYQRNLVMIKNSINPVNGAMPATTNPYAYGYKVWARDSAVTAMILDQAGFHEECRKYWYWLNARMRDDGTVGTCYDL